LQVEATEIYFSDYNFETIQRVNEDGSGLTTLISGLGGVRGVQIDATNGKIYWTQVYPTRAIRRANLDGTGIEDVLSTGSGVPWEIALDAAGGKIYWTQENGPPAIMRANLDGSVAEGLVMTGHWRPTGISLDLTAGKMYWADYFYGEIRRANLDGSNVETLIAGLSSPNHVVVDAANGFLYFTHGLFTPSFVSRSNLDGSGFTTLVSGESGASGLALDAASGTLFWTNDQGQSVRRATITGAGIATIVWSQSPLGIAVVSHSSQSGPVSWWRAEGNANDSAGSNHGSLAGGVGFTAGIEGQAFYFNGIDGSVNVPDSPSLNPGSELTVAFWMKADPDNPMTSCCQGLVTTDFWAVETSGGYHPRVGANFFAIAPGGWNHSSDVNGGGAPLAPGSWYHVAGVYDGTGLQLFVNGSAWGNPTPQSGPVAPMSGFLSIGSEDGRLVCPFCVNTRYFKGAIDEVLFFDRALDAAEIAEIAAVPGNQPPTANASAFTTLEYRSYQGTLSGSDPEHASLTYAVTSQPQKGWVTINDASAGTFTFTPYPGETGTDDFAFVASDGDRASAPAIVSLTIEPADPEVTVRLLDSRGGPLEGGVVTYYSAGWKPFGTTGLDGAARLVLPAASYPIRISYGGGSVQLTQDVSANPEVLFQTVEVAVRLRDSWFYPLDPGTAEYYASGWKPFGATSGGDVYKQLLPGSYTFAMKYEGGRIQKVQDIAADPNVVFQTVDVAVRLRDSWGNPLDQGAAEYYASGWKTIGTTGGGEVHKQLLPASYTFAMKYEGGRVQKQQDIAADPNVIFQTVDVAVRLRDSWGNPLDPGTAEYYASGWKPFGATSGGDVYKQLLPGSYTFAMKYEGGRIQKVQDIAADPNVVFQTVDVAVRLRDSWGNPLDQGAAEYYASGWKTIGTTGGGEVHKQLLPASYTFAMKYEGGRVQKQQDISADPNVVFQTGAVISDSATCTQYYASGWRPFTQAMQILPGSYTFKFSEGLPAQETFAVLAAVDNHIR
jgi:hypothetical protein